jgi:FkbM family methyltransferase
MNDLNLNRESINRWFADNGDATHNITYDLNEDSIVMDIGGYNGTWADSIIYKYNPNIYIVEPIKDFYLGMVNKFSNNKKVNLLNVGISTQDKNGFIFLNGDATSSNINNSKSIEVKFNTIETIFKKFKLNSVDLVQINIEGDEYSIMEYMIDNKFINRFRNIQIQFHCNIENNIIRREEIRKSLEFNGFKIKFDYPFVWESWEKKI